MYDSFEAFKVHEIRELKKRNNRDEAFKILNQIARQVQPILRKRRWTVPLLKEFFPGNPNLLVWTPVYFLPLKRGRFGPKRAASINCLYWLVMHT
jgi:hypothetical protein